MTLAEFERIDELARMRTYSAMAFERVMRECGWLLPQRVTALPSRR